MNTERPWDFSSFKSSIKDSSAHLNIYIIVDYRILEKKCLEKNRLQCMRRLSANVNDSRIWTPAEAERLRPRLKNGTGGTWHGGWPPAAGDMPPSSAALLEGRPHLVGRERTLKSCVALWITLAPALDVELVCMIIPRFMHACALASGDQHMQCSADRSSGRKKLVGL
jgi:hypothetical protein